MSHRINLARLKVVYADSAAAEARPTDDMDVIAEMTTYKAYAALEERLRLAGFARQ